MTATAKTTTKAVSTAAKKTAPKAAKNTPVTAEKKATKPAAKKTSIFALTAGLVVKLEEKHLKTALNYHVSKGNLKKTEKGVVLTEQGAKLWNADRVAKDPAKFQEIANWIHGKGAVPKEFAGQPATKVDTLNFPNRLYWGSFATLNMRLAFSALWAK